MSMGYKRFLVTHDAVGAATKALHLWNYNA